MTCAYPKNKRYTALSVGALVLMQGALVGCSGGWMDKDPWAFMTSSKSSAKNVNAPLTPAPPVVDALAQTPTYSPKLGGKTGSFGFNLQTYMVEDIQDPMDRIERLERAVLALHKDLQVMGPAVQNLSKLEGQIKELKAQMLPVRSLSSMPVMSGGQSAHNAPQRLVNAPSSGNMKTMQHGSRSVASTTGQAIVTGMRVGDHANKVRLVFDASKAISYSADIDNGEKIMVVDLPNSVWQGPTQERFGAGSPIKSYKVEKSGSGSIMVLQLRRSSSIVKKMVLDSLSGSGKRIVIDLSK